MKTSMAAFSPMLAAVMVMSALPLGCGAGTPQADSPESTEGDASTGESTEGNLMDNASGRKHARPDPEVKVTVKDDDAVDKGDAKPCLSDDFPDLMSTLAQAACEISADKASDKQRDLTGRLEVTVTPDAPKVAPGGMDKVTIVLHNKSPDKALSLDFAVDPEPRFEFQAFTAKGARADRPAGDAPPLPPEVQNAPEPDKGIARITLAPNGKAKLVAPWIAVKYKWASKDKAKGAVPGRGYPTEAAGPLPKGKYVLRVVMPLLNVSEGDDHPMTQPRTPIEVGAVP
jgi:hypothetical protein